ncbi:Uma2 family endonuclease [Endothiovibrio diazotrophicus]
MVDPAEQRDRLSHEEYFAVETAEGMRYEYLAGEVFAMTGGTENHAFISLATGAALLAAFRDLPCRVFGPDRKLFIAAADKFCYPDAMVLCEEGRHEKLHVEQPTLIVEVLSESTESYDRGLKFEHYRAIESLEYYLLLAQDRLHAELFQRHGPDRWLLTEASGEAGVIRLERWGIDLPLSELYRQVEF